MAILRTNGFVQLRRGLQEHITNGSMSVVQLGIYCLILMNADPATGIWIGSAGLVSSLAGQSPRTCRDAFERLEKAGYIKRFAVQGKHGSYPILVHRFECSDGAMKGNRLNALDTSSYDKPVYDFCHDDGDDDVNERVNDDVNDGAAKYLDNKRTDNKRKNPSRTQGAPDPRHAEFKALASRYWEFSNAGTEMPWDASEAGQLGSLLRSSPHLTAEQFRICLNNRHNSDGINTHQRPREWIGKITNYLGGTLNQFNQPKTGASNGKAEQRTEQIKHNAQEILRDCENRVASAETGDNPPVLPSSEPRQGGDGTFRGRMGFNLDRGRR